MPIASDPRAPQPDDVRLQVWVPRWLYDAVGRSAGAEGLTISAWVRSLLERALTAVGA